MANTDDLQKVGKGWYFPELETAVAASTGDPEKPLSVKQGQFVAAFLRGLRGADAAIAAGYSPGPGAKVTASRLIRKANVRSQIMSGLVKQAETTARPDIDADWVLTELTNLYQMAKTSKNLYVAKSALDSIGKHIDVGAFSGQSLGGEVYDALEYVLAQRERRLLADKSPGDVIDVTPEPEGVTDGRDSSAERPGGGEAGQATG